MRYMGGKQAIIKCLAPVLHRMRGGLPYLEPFVGGASVLAAMGGVRVAGDACACLITMYRALQCGWNPPDTLTESEYYVIKESADDADPHTAFAGFGCSFGGKYWGGYARGTAGRSYARNAANSLRRLAPRISGVRFVCADFVAWNPRGVFVYCDPPYCGTTTYKSTGTFSHEKFWGVVRRWAHNNIVVVSEYNAPPDFTCIYEFPTRLSLRVCDGRAGRVERLFVWEHGRRRPCALPPADFGLPARRRPRREGGVVEGGPEP